MLGIFCQPSQYVELRSLKCRYKVYNSAATQQRNTGLRADSPLRVREPPMDSIPNYKNLSHTVPSTPSLLHDRKACFSLPPTSFLQVGVLFQVINSTHLSLQKQY